MNSSASDWMAMLEIPLRSYANVMSAPHIALSEKIVERVANALELTPENLLNGNIDYKALARRSAGHATALPQRYSMSMYSKVRTSAYLLDFVEINYGWQARNKILRHFQMNESIIADPDMPISVRFLADLCDYLKANGFAANGFHEIGKFSSASNSKSKVAELFREERSPAKAYERCFTEIIGRYYDENNLYSLRAIGADRCSVQARPHPKLLDENHGHFYSTENICIAKAGVFASIMDYLSLPSAKVTEIECVHRGDSCCHFELDFSHAVWTYKQPRYQPALTL